MTTSHGIDRTGAAGGSGAQGMSGSLNELTDPNADRILFWDDSEGDIKFLSLDTGLSITGTVLSLDSDLATIAGLSAADGNFIVGNGTTWVVESGATARASLGIPAVQSPDALGDFVIGETASNPVSVAFPPAAHPLINGKIALSVAGSVLTVAIKGLDGSDPSASNPVFVRIQQGSPFDGTYAVRKITAALSITVSNGSTLGHANGTLTFVHIYALDNSGTIELAVSTKYFDQENTQSTTAEGGAGGADSATVLYSTTARTSVSITAILRWASTQTSAGVWASVTGLKELSPFNVPRAALTNIASVTGDAIATQAEQETGTEVTKLTTPGRQHFHTSAAKGWVSFNSAGTIGVSYNVTSVTDNGAGNWTVNWATDFSGADFVPVSTPNSGGLSLQNHILSFAALAAGTTQIINATVAGAGVDTSGDKVYIVAFGDQA